jgi:uncharacterized protein YqeY
VANTLKERLREDLNSARRERDKLRTLVLTTTLSELKNQEIAQGREAADADVVDVVSKAVKRRREAADAMRNGGREELALKEEQEAALLLDYLPQGLTEDEVRALARQAIGAGADNMGAVMGKLMPSIRGRFDGKEANRIVREELGA